MPASGGVPSSWSWEGTAFVAADRPTDRKGLLAMSKGMLATLESRWPPQVRDKITPEAVVDALSELGDLVTLRPGIAAHMLYAAKEDRPDPLGAAEGSLRWFGQMDSLNSVVGPLAQLTPQQRVAVRNIAAGKYSWRHLRAVQRGEALLAGDAAAGAVAAGSAEARWQQQMATLAACYCVPADDDAPARLLSPYGPALLTWISEDGHLDIDTDYRDIRLSEALRTPLRFMAWNRGKVRPGSELEATVSQAVMAALARHGIGVPMQDLVPSSNDGSTDAPACSVRPPTTVQEFEALPALRVLRAAYGELCNLLNWRHRDEHSHKLGELATAQLLAQAIDSTSSEIAPMPDVRRLGWMVLLTLHPYLKGGRLTAAENTCAPGRLTAAAAGDATRAAITVLTDPERGCFVKTQDGLQLLPAR